MEVYAIRYDSSLEAFEWLICSFTKHLVDEPSHWKYLHVTAGTPDSHGNSVCQKFDLFCFLWTWSKVLHITFIVLVSISRKHVIMFWTKSHIYWTNFTRKYNIIYTVTLYWKIMSVLQCSPVNTAFDYMCINSSWLEYLHEVDSSAL